MERSSRPGSVGLFVAWRRAEPAKPIWVPISQPYQGNPVKRFSPRRRKNFPREVAPRFACIAILYYSTTYNRACLARLLPPHVRTANPGRQLLGKITGTLPDCTALGVCSCV